jgi:hypothetical protein
MVVYRVRGRGKHTWIQRRSYNVDDIRKEREILELFEVRTNYVEVMWSDQRHQSSFFDMGVLRRHTAIISIVK